MAQAYDSSKLSLPIIADVAQMVERLPSKEMVVGSDPIIRFYAIVAELVQALD